MKKSPLILLAVFILVSSIGLASSSKKQFDLHISVPDKFSYISLSFPVGPIDRYTEGYSKGFREALEKHRDKKERVNCLASGYFSSKKLIAPALHKGILLVMNE